MTASDPQADLQTLPRGWRNLWRAYVTLPVDLHPEEFTIFVRGADRDDAHLAIRNALNSMFPSAAPHLDNDYYNLTSARDLVQVGVSERHVDRLFESGWMGDKVEGWVRSPVFVVPEAPALYAELRAIEQRLVAGATDSAALEAEAAASLARRGWLVDYISVRRQRDLKRPEAADLAAGEPLVALAAAKLCSTRLIDNLELA